MTIAIFGVAVPVSKLVISAGLLLDIVGVLLLFKFGLPEDVRRMGENYLLAEDTDEADIAKGKRYDRWARVALVLLVGGFVLQFIGIYM